jgi:hypothetical protein
VIPYSGGSSLEGNFSAPYGGVSVDFAFMDNIIKLNKEDMDIVVQPSIGWQDLNQKLADLDTGLFFPIDPGTLLADCTRISLLTCHRPKCKDWRNGWYELQRNQRRQVWNHERLGNQLDGGPGGWPCDQNSTKASQIICWL